MQLSIVKYPHPALRHQSRPLTSIDKEVRIQAGMMLELMYEHHGLGLASNQVALPFQMLVMNPTADPEQKDQEYVFINPVVMERQGGTMEAEEGCLSFPELFQKVRRPRTVRVQGYNVKGELIDVTWSDLPSRVLQHEIDHVNGVLFIDKMGSIGKMASRGHLRYMEAEHEKAQRKGTLPSDEEMLRQLEELEEHFLGAKITKDGEQGA